MLVESKPTQPPFPAEQIHGADSPLIGSFHATTASSSSSLAATTTTAATTASSLSSSSSPLHFHSNNSEIIHDNESFSKTPSARNSFASRNDNETLPEASLTTISRGTSEALSTTDSIVVDGRSQSPATKATTSSSTPVAPPTAENSNSLELMTVLLKDNNLPSLQPQSVNIGESW